MSTIASPRPSINASSRRSSASTDTTITSVSTKHTANTAAERGSLRRNRAALRDYYGLRAAGTGSDRHVEDTPALDAEQDSEIDKPGFNPETYVRNLLAQEGFEGVLRVEAGLVSDIRSLDGEKKALVYDNYSKLIAATDTIRNMREKMDPMTPTTSTLTPAIGNIAETAASLTAELKQSPGLTSNTARLQQAERKVQKALVRWVLAAPDRLRRLKTDGKIEVAEDDWQRVSACLTKWKDIEGAAEIRRKCEQIMAG